MWNCWESDKTRSLGFDDFAAAQAGSADADALSNALHLRMNRTKIDVPSPTADIVRVADRVSELRPLAANITNVCHDCSQVGIVPRCYFSEVR